VTPVPGVALRRGVDPPPPQGERPVALVGLDAALLGHVRTLCGGALPNGVLVLPDDPSVVRAVAPRLALVAFDPDGAPPAVAHALDTFPATRWSTLGTRGDPQTLRAAMRAGFRDHLALPADVATLRAWLGVIGTAPEPAGSEDGVIVALGARGGVGSTTLLLHAAAALAPVQRTCFLDLDLACGDAAALLALPPARGLAHWLEAGPDADARTLAHAVTVHASRLHLLPGSVPDEPRDDDALVRLLDVASSTYTHVCVDLGRAGDDARGGAGWRRAVLRRARHVVLVTRPDVLSVRAAWRAVRHLDDCGVAAERIHLVLSGWDPGRGGVGADDVADHLQRPVDVVVPWDAAVRHAGNEGRTVTELDPASRAGEAYAALVERLTGARPAARDPRGRWLRWLTGGSGR
jgi:Flp pilus assembly CpaE family ATPase